MSQQRGNWSSGLGFVLAATGSAVGLGNLWKFPFITWQNDGGAFVLVYLVCIAAVGMPIMLAEIMIGRKTQKAAVGAMKEAVGPAWGIVGGWGVLAGYVILSYYIIIAGWSLRYFAKTVGWTINGFPPGLDMGADFTAFASSGGIQVGLAALFMAATVGVVLMGVKSGIERTARLLLPILFAILLLLLFSALSLDGSGEALAFLFRPDFSTLGWDSVLEALGHAFFTLSLGMGAMITYGSYVGKTQSIVKAGAWIVLLDTVIALVAAIIMFSVIFSVPGMRDQVTGSPVGMLFISLPELFYTAVPFGNVLAPLFYVLVAFAALTSTVSLLEVVTSYMIDERGMDRAKASIVTGGAIFVTTVLAALSLGAVDGLSTFEVFEGKQGVFANLDHFASNWALPIGGFLITLAAGWFMTKEETEAELSQGGVPGWYSYGTWHFFIRYVAPLAVGAILVAVFVFGVDFS
jgi:NSS family neurotransmitter:Na+ symporter